MIKMEDSQNDMRAKIVAIMRDTSLTDDEKARKRQALMMGTWSKPAQEATGADDSKDKGKQTATESGAGPSSSLDENLKCAICLNLCERPVTAPCQHNFCLGCFNKWTNQGKKTCPTCRAPFPSKFAQNPRINTALTYAIRLAKNPVKLDTGAAKDYKRIDNESRPDQAFVTERAVRAGRANAASGRIMVNIPNDHFGPIVAEHDPVRGQGVLVGEFWKDRLDCRQWGAHFPHVAGIAGQSNVGAQSVVISGGYEDDRDEGEWFLYTGSGGRDLSGNKRTNKVQSFDQEFENMNKALQLSCLKGMPVRVVRSFKEKRSAYAPSDEQPVRYDGIYRILRCWRKPGNQKHLICRYLFMRCDNNPAPWSSAETGDEIRLDVPEEAEKEIKQAVGKVFEMAKDPFWDYDPVVEQWGWAKPAPASQRVPGVPRQANPEKKLKQKVSDHEKALKAFRCGLCKDILKDPLSTPCGHQYCRGCLDKKFEGITDIMAPTSRTLRVRKNLKPCPACNADLCDFLSTAQVNREVIAVIQKLQEAVAQAKEQQEKLKNGETVEAGADSGDEEADGEEVEEGAEAEQEDEEQEAKPSGDDGAGTSKAAEAAADEAGPSQPAASAGTSAGAEEAGPSTSAAAEPAAATTAAAAKPSRYDNELTILKDEFPEFDEVLILSFLEDQGGDLLDVRVFLKKLSKQQKAKSPCKAKAAAAKAKSSGDQGKGKKGKGQGKGRKRKAEESEEDEVVDEEEGAEEEGMAVDGEAGGEGGDGQEKKKAKV